MRCCPYITMAAGSRLPSRRTYVNHDLGPGPIIFCFEMRQLEKKHPPFFFLSFRLVSQPEFFPAIYIGVLSSSGTPHFFIVGRVCTRGMVKFFCRHTSGGWLVGRWRKVLLSLTKKFPYRGPMSLYKFWSTLAGIFFGDKFKADVRRILDEKVY